MNPKVAIIILNWNGWRETVECLESLYQITYSNYIVILVDNGSQDNSIQKIKEYCEGDISVASKTFEYSPENKSIKIINYVRNDAEVGGGKEKEIADLPSSKKLILIENEKNYGFAEGNNIGFNYAIKAWNPDYVLLLNNDTFVDKEFLGELVKVVETDERIGSAQSLLLRPGGKIIDSKGQELLIWGARDKGFNSKYKRILKANLEIFGACAAAALYRSKVLKDIGLFDKNFFIYFEDLDLSWRIRLRGLKSVLAHKSIVYHKRGRGSPSFSIKKYHGSKNWLIIALRYYPFSIRFFRTLFKCVYYALKIGKIPEIAKIIAKNWKIRKKIKTTSLLNKIQCRWIKSI